MSNQLKVEVSPNAEQLEALTERVKALHAHLDAAIRIAREIGLTNLDVEIKAAEE